MNKDNIRRNIRAQKSLLSEQERQEAAERVFAMLENSAAFLLAENVLMYHSLPDELSTRRFIDKWCSRKHFFLPRVNGVNLDILPYERTRMHLGAFQIEEPDGDETVSIDAIDMVVVPAMAYDRQGNRVGRGKGYYDRMLGDCGVTKVGVCYGFQLVDSIDTDPHDVGVDVVITDKEYIVVRRVKG